MDHAVKIAEIKYDISAVQERKIPQRNKVGRDESRNIDFKEEKTKLEHFLNLGCSLRNVFKVSL